MMEDRDCIDVIKEFLSRLHGVYTAVGLSDYYIKTKAIEHLKKVLSMSGLEHSAETLIDLIQRDKLDADTGNAIADVLYALSLDMTELFGDDNH